MRLLPERDPHLGLYKAACVTVENLCDREIIGNLMVRFELALLDELGFGLDLEQCAATGVRDDLIYVSPKSGRAVSRSAGTPWADKMLALPDFLTGNKGQPLVLPEPQCQIHVQLDSHVSHY